MPQLASGAYAYPRGSCLYSTFFRTPAVHMRPSSLHLLQGNSPSHWSRVSSRADNYSGLSRALTFVFFIRHRSHAFHTRLCLPSDVGECGSEWLVAALMMLVPPMRFDARCVDLEVLLEADVFLEGLWPWSSVGGVGMLCPIVATSREEVWGLRSGRWMLGVSWMPEGREGELSRTTGWICLYTRGKGRCKWEQVRICITSGSSF